jgi:ribulose-5-phosphate 4-epimerase/fuculose-1-phosphate aldolase
VSASGDVTVLRRELAAAFQLCHRLGWSKSVGTHFSAAVSDDERQFLLNPRRQYFATIEADDLLLLDADDRDVMAGPDAPDASAWTVHGTLHRMLPEARVLLHCRSPYAVAPSCLKDPMLPPIDNNTARLLGRIGYDLSFGGLGDDAAERPRLACAIKEKSTLLMGNHGVLAAGAKVADAFEDLYFFEKAAQTVMLTLASARPLAVRSDEVGQATVDRWIACRGMARRLLDYLISTLGGTPPAAWTRPRRAPDGIPQDVRVVGR